MNNVISCIYCNKEIEAFELTFHVKNFHKSIWEIGQLKCPFETCKYFSSLKEFSSAAFRKHINIHCFQTSNKKADIQSNIIVNNFECIDQRQKNNYKDCEKVKDKEMSLEDKIMKIFATKIKNGYYSDKTMIGMIDFAEKLLELGESKEILSSLNKLNLQQKIKTKGLSLMELTVPEFTRTVKIKVPRDPNLKKKYKKNYTFENKVENVVLNAYHINLRRMLEMYLKRLSKRGHGEFEGRYIKAFAYIDDIVVNNPLGSRSKNGNLTHFALRFSINDSFDETTLYMSRKQDIITFSIAKAAQNVKDKYQRFIRSCIDEVEKTIFKNIHGNLCQIDIVAVLCDHKQLHYNLGLKHNWQGRGKENVCPCCTIIPDDYSKYKKCVEVRSFLKDKHNISFLKEKGHVYTDFFHGLHEGIVAYSLYSCICRFLLISGENLSDFTVGIFEKLNSASMPELNAILKSDFFEMKLKGFNMTIKNKYLLSGSETIMLLIGFYEFIVEYILTKEYEKKEIFKTIYVIADFALSCINLVFLMEDHLYTASYIAAKVDEKIDKLIQNVYEFYGDQFVPSYKYHILFHYRDMIENLGHPLYLSTKPFESSNKRLKDWIKNSSNKRNIPYTILSKYIFHEEMMMHIDEEKDEIDIGGSLYRRNWVYPSNIYDVLNIVKPDRTKLIKDVNNEMRELEKIHNISFTAFEDENESDNDNRISQESSDGNP